jgi:hypothetical protein
LCDSPKGKLQEQFVNHPMDPRVREDDELTYTLLLTTGYGDSLGVVGTSAQMRCTSPVNSGVAMSLTEK